ncbi:tetratricopeptide repeat protein [Amphritea sp. 2_MG-2023]|uniref:tetratricopeptide repeat protein n=1 Tax=Amphritea TaxID=515417 RepID=UPI001C06BAE1|nr:MULTISPECIES: tetratricopeptide repeat protein [Amphritea]MBU2964993.1 tetratricopeptide repeat protein [Amphritea atlantica]MDO6418778.1 tetratricopeptide repeat protein [Amphritea sp. 2_MG-2023]
MGKDISYSNAEDSYNKKQWPLAYERYAALLEKPDCDKRLVLLFLADIAEKLNDYCLAIKNYKILVSCFEPDILWFFRMAENYRSLNEWEKSILVYQKVIEAKSTHLGALFGLSKCYYSLGKFKNSLISIESAIDIKCNSQYFAQKGLVLMKLKEWRKAASSYQEAIDFELGIGKSIWFVRQAQCYAKLHDYSNVIRCYLAALNKEQEKGTPAWYAELASAYLKSGQKKLAIGAYRRAVELDDSHVNWYAELGRLLADSDKKAAIEAYQRAVDLGYTSLTYEVAILSSDSSHLSYVAPEVLMSPWRFDLCAKILYARFLLGFTSSHSGVDIEGLYLRHIYLRTKGDEPGNLAKMSLQDYRESFIQLVASIEEHGFYDNHAIPLGQDAVLMNGAHRSAVAMALNLPTVPVMFMDKPVGTRWDFTWFVQRGFDLNELNELMLCWLESTQNKSHIVILWPAVIEYWDEITETIARDVNLVTQRDILFTEPGMSELIKDIYSIDKVAEFMPSIMAKVERLASYSSKVRVLVVGCDTARVNTLKTDIRQKYEAVMPESCFCTLHTSDNFKETMHLARIFFHAPTLNMLRQRKKTLSPHLSKWIAQVKAELLKRGESILDGCAVGGAVLDAYGIRQADDLDITVTNSVREMHFSDKASALTESVDIVNKNYAKDVTGIISDDTLLSDRALHLYIRGFKFANLDIVRKRKTYSQRDKDLDDLEKIGRYFLDM